MGPYCNFCNQRCFVHMPAGTPAKIVAAYGTSTIIATCPAGQKFEREKVGYCYDDIKRAIASAPPPPPPGDKDLVGEEAVTAATLDEAEAALWPMGRDRAMKQLHEIEPALWLMIIHVNGCVRDILADYQIPEGAREAVAEQLMVMGAICVTATRNQYRGQEVS